MAYLRHPKILQLYGCSLTAQAIWIVSELCSHGSLRQVLDDVSVDLSVETRLRMAVDVAEGMLYLHTRDHPIVHRDLKSHNQGGKPSGDVFSPFSRERLFLVISLSSLQLSLIHI